MTSNATKTSQRVANFFGDRQLEETYNLKNLPDKNKRIKMNRLRIALYRESPHQDILENIVLVLAISCQITTEE
jgi:hypothetical protein